MALVTVQRSPNSSSKCQNRSTDDIDCFSEKSEKEQHDRKGSISECYFAVKGAALVLPHDECLHIHRKNIANGTCDIQKHLQAMLYFLHADDILKMAVKLESMHSSRTRYLVIVQRCNEESALLGVDCNAHTTIGLMLPVWADTRITLDGDGGFSVTSSGRHHIFKPVSVQAMWSALQMLHRSCSKAREYNHFICGGTHQWVDYYEKKINSDRSCLNEWHAMDDIESRRPPSPDTVRSQPTEREATEQHIKTKLKELMMSVDLDEVTSKYIRTRLEEILDMNLREYKSFIDQEMLTILGQMDAPTQIFQYLYLGSEWNASNLEELVLNGIGHILNVTREIDNFFPGMFDYQNIRVYDDESTEILHYWDRTYRYIRRAKDEGSKVLVHCKMGISRSASVVIAYVMKAYDWDLQRALQFVKTKRSCIKPNSGFLKQLEIYQGILDASKQRHNSLWRSKSETNLKSTQQPKKGEKQKQKSESHLGLRASSPRPKSWSPSDVVADMLFPTEPADPFTSLGNTIMSTATHLDIRRTSEGSKSSEILSVDATLPRVSSIKDRINELEHQKSSNPAKSSEMKSPTSQARGLVFNLANQFEAGSKPSSPVDEGLFMKCVSDEEIVQPVVSQMKPPASKHHAFLVKPGLWGEDGKQAALCSNVSSNIEMMTTSETTKTFSSKFPKFPSRAKSLEESSSFAQSSPKPANKTNCFVQETTKLTERLSVKTSQTSRESTKVVSQISKFAATSTKEKVADKPKSLPKSKETREISAPIIRPPPTNRHSHSELSNHLYEREEIPFTPGKVMRTKQKIEEKNLTRTTSFDSGFPLSCANIERQKPIRRSRSLRNDRRFCSRWYPLPALASLSPVRPGAYQEVESSILSTSSPSVVEAVNRVICGTQEVLSSAIKMSSTSSDSDFDFGSATSLPDIDSNVKSPTQRESPIPGLVKLQREILESKATKSKPSPLSPEHNLVNLSDAENIKDSGIVKRLKKELEAKSGSENDPKELPTTLPSKVKEISNPPPPTPNRKTSLDLNFKFPFSLRFGTQPSIRPNSRTGFSAFGSPVSDNSGVSKSQYVPPTPPVGLPRKLRKQQGSTHPLSKLMRQRHPNPLYNTM